MIYENESSENVTNISKTALKDFYEIRSLVQTFIHNEQMDIGNPTRADKREFHVSRVLAICEKWINASDPIELD